MSHPHFALSCCPCSASPPSWSGLSPCHSCQPPPRPHLQAEPRPTLVRKGPGASTVGFTGQKVSVTAAHSAVVPCHGQYINERRAVSIRRWPLKFEFHVIFTRHEKISSCVGAGGWWIWPTSGHQSRKHPPHTHPQPPCLGPRSAAHAVTAQPPPAAQPGPGGTPGRARQGA